MKLKVIKRELKEIETNLDLPVYLYFQDEYCNDTLVKVTDKVRTSIIYSNNSFQVLVEYTFITNVLDFEKHLTTEDHFNSVYSEALKKIAESIS